ncbi:MAG: PEGA domain-containing protein, partial [Elusimicrobiota bacterium]
EEPVREIEEVQKEEEKEKTATLIIDTRPHFPGASIFLNGKLIGETVRRIKDLSLGEYVVAIQHPYVGKIKERIKIDEPDKKIIIKFNSAGEVEIHE